METSLPTRSLPEEGPHPGTGLPITFDRRFRPWRYSVSHSELSLRSVGAGPSDDVIEVTFYGVLGMKLKTVYQPLAISVADRERAGEILKFADVKETQASKVQCLVLNAGADDSFVACIRFSIWAHHRDAEYDLSGVPRRESTLIARG